ncbi:hypothetical protein [Lacticaseibacillus jixiensis]|uniref:hypothetical protein n=1 Tax=Lacticaseibacillus jixiensis TaxID=3231926 RepID=UPI0036F1D1CB
MDYTESLKKKIDLSLEVAMHYYESYLNSKKLIDDAKKDELAKKQAVRDAKHAAVRATTNRKNAELLTQKDHDTLVNALKLTEEIYKDPQESELLKHAINEKMPLAFADEDKQNEPKTDAAQPKTQPAKAPSTPHTDTKTVAPASANAPKPTGSAPQAVHTTPANQQHPQQQAHVADIKGDQAKPQMGHATPTSGSKPSSEPAKNQITHTAQMSGNKPKVEPSKAPMGHAASSSTVKPKSNNPFDDDDDDFGDLFK